MALWLSIVPLLIFEWRFPKPEVGKSASRRRRRGRPAAAAVVISVAAAELGRRRAGGHAYFPATSSLLAPVWILERGVCAWLAVLQRLRFGGVRYGDSVIPVAAHSERELRRPSRRSPSAPRGR